MFCPGSSRALHTAQPSAANIKDQGIVSIHVSHPCVRLPIQVCKHTKTPPPPGPQPLNPETPLNRRGSVLSRKSSSKSPQPEPLKALTSKTTHARKPILKNLNPIPQTLNPNP